MEDNYKDKIPNAYFDKLTNKIFDKIENLDDNIQEAAPTLFKLGNDLGYDIPEHYFNALADTLKPKINKPSSRFISPRWMAVAASLLLVLSCIVIIDLQSEATSTNDIVFEEVMDYYIDNSEDIDESFLIDLESGADIAVDYLEGISDDELELYIEMTIDDYSEEDIDQLF